MWCISGCIVVVKLPITHCIIPEILLNHLNSFCRGMFKHNAKFDADSLLYLLSHFECDGHTVPMFTQWRLLPPLTSTMKSSLFTQAHSGPRSVAARLHQCCANCSCYINNGWTFSGQTSYAYTEKVSSKFLLWKFESIQKIENNNLRYTHTCTHTYQPGSRGLKFFSIFVLYIYLFTTYLYAYVHHKYHHITLFNIWTHISQE